MKGVVKENTRYEGGRLEKKVKASLSEPALIWARRGRFRDSRPRGNIFFWGGSWSASNLLPKGVQGEDKARTIEASMLG